jgi:hypothetical protein
MRAELDRLDELADRYGLPRTEGRWQLLSLMLAQEYVPGFRADSPAKGRPPSISTFELVRDVDLVRTAEGCSIERACEVLSGRAQPWGGWDADNLKRKYFDCRRRLETASAATKAMLSCWDSHRKQETLDVAWNSLSRADHVRRFAALAEPMTELFRNFLAKSDAK